MQRINDMFVRGDNALAQMTQGMIPLSQLDAVQGTPRGDSYDSEFVDQVLQKINNRTYNRVYQPHPFLELVNLDFTGGPGLDSHKYFEGDAKARWARMGDASADIPTSAAQTLRKPIVQGVETYWSGYEVKLKELERYQRAGSDAVPRKAMAVTAAYLDLLVLHTLCGDREAGIDGLLSCDRIKNRKALSSTERLDLDSTATELSDFLMGLARSIPDESASIYGQFGMGGYAIALPASMKRVCDTTFFGSDSNISVTARFEAATGYTLIGLERLKNIPEILMGDDTSGTDTTGVAIAGSFSPATHAKQVPVPVQFMSPFVDMAGFRTTTPARCDLGGIEIYAPNAFAIRTNVWSNTSS